jgi:hypothetical protein
MAQQSILTLPDDALGDDGPGLHLELMARLSAAIEGFNERSDKAERERYQIGQSIYPIPIPAGSGVVTGGGTLTIASPELFGPRTGKAWDVRRITVSGLKSNSETITLYKGSTGTAADAVGFNAVFDFSPPSTTPAKVTYTPGLGAVLLRQNTSLSLTGASLTAAEVITVSWDAIEVAEEWLGAYLL